MTWRHSKPAVSPTLRSLSVLVGSWPSFKSTSPRQNLEGHVVRTPARILIADDNPDNLDIFRSRLAANGYEILTACDGEEALAIARETTPDLILLDYMMPK